MYPSISGKPIDYTCSEPAIPEFPELLFGTSIENGTKYFDATLYLQTKRLSIKIDDFFKECKTQIKSLQQSYRMEENEICKLNKEGHLLIDGNFAYLFISFVEPEFLAYIFDRIHELFSSGFCVSDTYLLFTSKKRLSNEALETIIEHEPDKQ